MDDDTIRESLAGFEAVWQRVTGRTDGPGPAAYPEAETLRRFIDAESCAARYTAALARMFQGEGRAALTRHAGQAARRARRLRAEYYIREGVTLPLREDCPAVAGKLASLRQCLLREEDTAAGYEAAAERTPSPELAAVYRAFAAQLRRQARESRSLLIESF